MQRRSLLSTAIRLAALGAAGCCAHRESEAAVAAPADSARAFAHPGLLHTEADFARMRKKVGAQAEPWLSGWNALLASGRSQLGAAPRPLTTVVRGGPGENFAQLYIDIARTYQLALRWKVSGDTRYADLAVTFLNAWSSTLTSITGNADRFLAAGIYGYQFANAAEIMRSYPGWAAADLARFQNMMLTVFYPLSADFLVRHNDAVITNYWANWDQCSLACILAVGVLCDRADIYDEAIAYYKLGGGNGAGLQAVHYVHPGYLGQWQESGRDQGHCTLGIGLAGAFCEMAWNQGDDLYGYDKRRYLAGAQYVAKSNLTDDSGAFFPVPYLVYSNRQGTSTALSGAGQGHRRPVWEMALHHYEGRLGVATGHVAAMAEAMRPEGDGGNGDQLGFGTLTFAREARTGRAPTGLSTRLLGKRVVLSWWGTPDAVTYTVRRAKRSGGPYTAVATGITGLHTWTDTLEDKETTYWYVVVAVSASGKSSPSNEVSASRAPRLWLHLPFNERAGKTAVDATERWAPSVLSDGVGRVDGHKVRAVQLDGRSSYIQLPAGVLDELSDFTIAVWVYLDTASTWARIFDFGSGTRRYMFLTARGPSGGPRFGMSLTQGYNEQVVDSGTPLPTQSWVHLAVSMRDRVGTLYIDGVASGTNTSMLYVPCDLGSDTAGWVGRSQFPADPYLHGRVDDFRVYNGALSAKAIAELAGLR